MKTRSSSRLTSSVAMTAKKNGLTRQKYNRKTRTPQNTIKTEELAEKEPEEEEPEEEEPEKRQEDASDSILDTVIKREDNNEETKNILGQFSNDNPELPDRNDPNNYCKSCERTFVRQQNYHAHLKLIHKMYIPKKGYNTDKITKIDDINSHCPACDTTFATNKLYRYHLRFAHNMKLPKKKAKLKDPTCLPDIEDPDNYCKVCELFFITTKNYRGHLRSNHQIEVEVPRKKHDILPDPNDPQLRCGVCHIEYVTVQRFRHHLRNVHKMELEPLKKDPEGIKHLEPDPDDADFYCRVCDIMFLVKTTYKTHIRTVHNTTAKKVARSDLIPDYDGSNTYCKSCEKFFANISTFRCHLRKIHQIIPILLQKSVKHKNPDVIHDLDYPNHNCASCSRNLRSPAYYFTHLDLIHDVDVKAPATIYDPSCKADIDSPNETYYCTTCKRHYSKSGHVCHMLTVHKDRNDRLILSSKRKRNRDKPVDVDDPNRFCKTCEVTFSNKGNYKRHIKKIHNLAYQQQRRMIINSDTFCCICCNEKFSTRDNYSCHMKNTHKMELKENADTLSLSSPAKRDEIEFSSGNELTCKICNAELLYKRTYIIHMMNSHNQLQRPLILDCNPKHSIIPETEKYSISTTTTTTTTYCQACDFTFDSANHYRRHLIDLHHIECEPVSKNDPIIFSQKEIDDLQFTYCKICDIELVTKPFFSSHMGYYHEVMNVNSLTRKKLRIQRNDNILPNLDDPNAYCRVCDRYFRSRACYCRHLYKSHGIIAKKPYRNEVPDPEDSRFYCRVCKLLHFSKEEYINHLILIHNYPGEINEAKKNGGGLLLDPFYCDVPDTKRTNESSGLVNSCRCFYCDKMFENNGKYKVHMRLIHKIHSPKPVHTSNLENRCIKCNITFRTIILSSKHKKQFHSDSETIIKAE